MLTFFTGYADENDRIINGGFPGKLLDLSGIWAEEIDALVPEVTNAFTYNGITYPAKLLCDIIHPNDTEVLARYEKRFYAGTPVITKNSYGDGKSYYVGTRSNEEFYQTFVKDICKEAGVDMVLYEGLEEREYPISGLEITKRTKEDAEYIFVLNYQEETKAIQIPFPAEELLSDASYQPGDKMEVKPIGVAILKKNIL